MGWYFTITEEMRAIGLSGNELIVFALINSYSQKGNGVFFGGINFICEVCGISRATAFNVLEKLMEKELIFKNEIYHNGVKYVTYKVSLNNRGVVQNLDSGSLKSIPNIERTYINDNTLSKNKRSSKFQKPSVEEVREYCQSRGNGIDAETFINFYESKGWVVGKSPMKDWKAAIRTWEKRTPIPSAPRTQTQFPQRESVYQHNMRELQKWRERNGMPIDNQ